MTSFLGTSKCSYEILNKSFFSSREIQFSLGFSVQILIGMISSASIYLLFDLEEINSTSTNGNNLVSLTEFNIKVSNGLK